MSITTPTHNQIIQPGNNHQLTGNSHPSTSSNLLKISSSYFKIECDLTSINVPVVAAAVAISGLAAAVIGYQIFSTRKLIKQSQQPQSKPGLKLVPTSYSLEKFNFQTPQKATGKHIILSVNMPLRHGGYSHLISVEAQKYMEQYYGKVLNNEAKDTFEDIVGRKLFYNEINEIEAGCKDKNWENLIYIIPCVETRLLLTSILGNPLSEENKNKIAFMLPSKEQTPQELSNEIIELIAIPLNEELTSLQMQLYQELSKNIIAYFYLYFCTQKIPTPKDLYQYFQNK